MARSDRKTRKRNGKTELDFSGASVLRRDGSRRPEEKRGFGMWIIAACAVAVFVAERGMF